MTLSRRAFLKSGFAVTGLTSIDAFASPWIRALLNESNSYHALYLNKYLYNDLTALLAKQLHLYQDSEIHAQALECVSKMQDEGLIYQRLSDILANSKLNMHLLNMHRLQDQQVRFSQYLTELTRTHSLSGYISFGLPNSEFDPINHLPFFNGQTYTMTHALNESYSPLQRTDFSGVIQPIELIDSPPKINASSVELAAIYDGPHSYSSTDFTRMMLRIKQAMPSGGKLVMPLFNVQQPAHKHVVSVFNDWKNLLHGRSWQAAQIQRDRLQSLTAWHKEMAIYGYKVHAVIPLEENTMLPEYLSIYEKV
ncbi:hypothetical protein L1286_22235 [Pseudoalteromonas sp. SMS1]|uniref:hypothetical protein n=1 Tax=Pseudoalteromonas sp. SMS1 TaxID=2908894 RepID=UPI001F417B5A|nr:hypothetical protein [Pseudoalteromonas sp. SMS1]MCF2860203.1 hypothetical protein [Pseudoalteromonas sp. SMS1]